ncbi:hypothetical protein [Kineococcus sp. SYSU DK004]|uniref:hypothetical protein n=1 Tax=Kineococcus sp. SYSU DK004 TaxID=3383125 RepID=UPI003D7CB07F
MNVDRPVRPAWAGTQDRRASLPAGPDVPVVVRRPTALVHLAPSDLAFIAASTGEHVDPAAGQASTLAWTLAHDRADGTLAPGHPVTPAYLQRLASVFGTASGGVDDLFTAAQLRTAHEYLDAHGGAARTDFRA